MKVSTKHKHLTDPVICTFSLVAVLTTWLPNSLPAWVPSWWQEGSVDDVWASVCDNWACHYRSWSDGDHFWNVFSMSGFSEEYWLCKTWKTRHTLQKYQKIAADICKVDLPFTCGAVVTHVENGTSTPLSFGPITERMVGIAVLLSGQLGLSRNSVQFSLHFTFRSEKYFFNLEIGRGQLLAWTDLICERRFGHFCGSLVPAVVKESMVVCSTTT